ncbi:hypothetical protein [Caldithrix abyssi]|uniref:Cytochrome c domain-containing protein n=1 Tax=Caldithrix abyssi DSM 13497 TaxID=880073 RepID=H1XZ02_CALAY|nr:hypothetical protein [Caldithrix abyssi]APF18026.1 hypothetical protein Cabys_1277 [Caldithrix abyssi DSM 13497]EHO42073.1 hypothetical protein Calab_2463 [Caldithrix abyssi DSM 13497]
MKLRLLWGISVALGLIWIGCTPKTPSRPISEEERLFRSKCVSCHSLPDVQQKRDWEALLQNHEKKLKLNQQQREMLLRYFSSFAQ